MQDDAHTHTPGIYLKNIPPRYLGIDLRSETLANVEEIRDMLQKSNENELQRELARLTLTRNATKLNVFKVSILNYSTCVRSEITTHNTVTLMSIDQLSIFFFFLNLFENKMYSLASISKMAFLQVGVPLIMLSNYFLLLRAVL